MAAMIWMALATSRTSGRLDESRPMRELFPSPRLCSAWQNRLVASRTSPTVRLAPPRIFSNGRPGSWLRALTSKSGAYKGRCKISILKMHAVHYFEEPERNFRSQVLAHVGTVGNIVRVTGIAQLGRAGWIVRF